MLKKKNSNQIWLLGAFICLIVFTSACKEEDVLSNNHNTFQGDNPLIGEWYEVGSTDAKGTKVIFTETNVTAFHYAYNYVHFGSVYNYEEKWYDNAKYLFNNDTLEVLDLPICGVQAGFLKTSITFHSKDTLTIERFVPTDAAIGFPYNFTFIKLYRRILQ